MEDSVKKLITEMEGVLKNLESEVRTLSCEVNPHPDDLILCDKLSTKIECYRKFINKLNKL